ncbi:unnamed protein product, partial [Prorocentrum cordatum]
EAAKALPKADIPARASIYGSGGMEQQTTCGYEAEETSGWAQRLRRMKEQDTNGDPERTAEQAPDLPDVEMAQQPMADRPHADEGPLPRVRSRPGAAASANESETAKKGKHCALADKVGVHGYWNALDYCHERFKKEGKPDPRLDLNVMPPGGPRPEYITALKSLGKILANIIKPEAAPAFARLDFPQACAALSSLMKAAGIPSRISGKAICLYAAYGIPYKTLKKWAGRIGADLGEGDRMFNGVEHLISSDSTVAFVSSKGKPALNSTLK